jgi:hypothetical protein
MTTMNKQTVRAGIQRKFGNDRRAIAKAIGLTMDEGLNEDMLPVEGGKSIDIEKVFRQVAEKCAEHGMAPTDIEDILKVLSDCISGTAKPAEDTIPENATAGGMSGAFSKFGSGRIETERADRQPSGADRRRQQAADSAMHSSSTADRITRRYPDIARIKVN